MTSVIWDWIGKISGLVGLFGSAAALLAWLQAKKISANTEAERRRLNQEVTIVLKGMNDETNKVTIPFALRRGEITRSEILGLIGMLPMRKDFDRSRFKIRFLSSEAFRKEMSRIQDASGISEFVIPCSPEEMNQFDSEAIDQND